MRHEGAVEGLVFQTEWGSFTLFSRPWGSAGGIVSREWPGVTVFWDCQSGCRLVGDGKSPGRRWSEATVIRERWQWTGREGRRPRNLQEVELAGLTEWLDEALGEEIGELSMTSRCPARVAVLLPTGRENPEETGVRICKETLRETDETEQHFRPFGASA